MEGLGMKPLLILIALGVCACDQEPQQSAAAPPPAASQAVIPTQSRISKAPLVVPMPKDQAELDRMILAGYTPHGNHLHPPGVTACPLTKGSEAVM
jgi:hypothetical protein